MNKQQLASKIWESANKMRSKIDANDYKDYMLGFIFYKFLSTKEEKFLKKIGYTDETIKSVSEDNPSMVKNIQESLGYFIGYKDLFSTWLKKGKDFDVSDVRDGLQRFDRLINRSHEKVFRGVFDTLEQGLTKLGENTSAQTNAIRDLISLINDIPMDGKEDYDVLGFTYEYLISNFAANAGKKAGEFYTPHEVSVLMSDIIANHLKDKEEISIYDPTSGSGSLLINIGKSVSKYVKDKNKIKYYAQELKENTYNLTRMNLVMRGILPDNIVTRNGDTLKDDWPMFDDSDPEGTYHPLFVDAVVSNPPYSQNWEPEDMANDTRFKEYGLAPKSKADYAFLLHDLYHLNPTGIMTIVLPHGVLFRGKSDDGSEGEIRKNLIEKNRIDTIIGLPANIFYGTGIPTIIMVLKKDRPNTDVLIVDASKGFEKDGNKNKLRARDIKKIVDVVINRTTVSKFSRVVTRDEIRKNEYNLNIPRYVDSSDRQETYDIYSSMYGGIPNYEINYLNDYFEAFPNIKKDLFENINNDYSKINIHNLNEFILNHKDVKNFKEDYNNRFNGFKDFLKSELIDNLEQVKIDAEEEKLSNEIFKRLDDVKLIDNYEAYQILDEKWNRISGDLEILLTEGKDSARKVDPNMVVKKVNGKDVEKQDGYIGRVIPFELVQKDLLKDELDNISKLTSQIDELDSKVQENIESFNEEDIEKYGNALNEDNSKFNSKELTNLVKELKKSKDFENNSIEIKIIESKDLLDKIKDLNKELKNANLNLLKDSKEKIENLTDEEIDKLLIEKWINPICKEISELPDKLVVNFIDKIVNLSKKYDVTLDNIEEDIYETEKDLSSMIEELTGSEYDLKGLEEFKNILNK